MNSRERIAATCNHAEPDKLVIDFGAGFQTGLHVSIIYKLRQALGLDAPGTPVKVIETFQMLGEVKPDLMAALNLDAVSVHGTGTMFGFPATDFKEWTMADGTPTLVPGLFNTDYEPNGDLYQYPEGDKAAGPSACLPAGGYFFDAIPRESASAEDDLNVDDNLEEFGPISDAELAVYKERVEDLYTSTDKALFLTMGGLSFGDIALVPAPWLKAPRGVRDVSQWYMLTALRPDHVQAIFDRQCDIALDNLKRMYETVGDKISVIITNGTDFGTQNGPFCSPTTYRSLYLPYQKRLYDWIHANTSWKIFMHSCGAISPLLDGICEAGFDILNPVQCSASDMDPADLKKNYGDRLTFWGGGVDTQKTLPFGTPEAVRDQVRERVDILAPGGGFVFNGIHNIQAETPVENLLAMFETLREYR